jgi:hypothetical protein
MIEASDEVYILLGRISMAMERIHHRVASLISSICGRKGRFPQIEQALTACVSLRQTTDLCEMLFLSLSDNDESKKEFKGLIKRVRDLEQIRNGIVHSIWLPTAVEGEFVKWKFAKDKENGIKFVSDSFDFKEISTVAESCGTLEKDLLFFLIRDFERGGSPFHVHEIT